MIEDLLEIGSWELMPWLGLGVLNAPVDARCKDSYSSCSSFGRRGGAGSVVNEDE